MKKLLFYTFVFAVVVPLCATMLVACSDDDDDDNSKAPKVETDGTLRSDASIITTESGESLVLTYNEYWNFDYNKDGQCTKMYDYWDSLNLNDPKNVTGTIEWDYEMKLSYNSAGYISKVVANWVDNIDSYDLSGSYTVTVSYNDDDQVSQLYIDASESYSDSKETSTYKSPSTIDFTYKNGNLTGVSSKIDWSESGKYDGEKFSDSGTDTYSITFEYSNDENLCQRYTCSQMGYIGDICMYTWDISGFFYIGWLGNGSKNLPSSVKTVNENSKTSTSSIEFDLNDNGTIDKDYYSSSYRSYIYEEIDYSKSILSNKSISTSESISERAKRVRPHHHEVED